MPNENKPTPEELKAQEEEAIKLAEEIEANGVPQEEEEEIQVKLEDTDIPNPEEQEEGIEEEAAPAQEEEQAEPSKEVFKKKLEDEKKKSSASARENQKIYAKNRVINQALVEADDIPEPTDEELMEEFKDWDVMSEAERTFAKEAVMSRSWRQVISKAKEQATKIENWNKSVNEYIDNPQTLLDNPDLEGKTEEFAEFATRNENNSVPLSILVNAFLYEHTTNTKSHKGERMFENGSGGPNDKPQPKTGKISMEQARRLRETNYDKWKEYNQKGLIDFDL